jgi:ribosome-binding factor A
MSAARKDKIISMLKKITADFLKEVGNKEFLITVTGFEVSKDLKRAFVKISVYPETKEEDAINIIKNKRKELRNFAMSKTKMKMTPAFDFEVDKGEKNRQRIDKLLYDIKE